jgi:hypothetical protein
MLRGIFLVVPLILCVAFAGVISFLSLFLSEDRRDFALEFSEIVLVKFGVLVGAPGTADTTPVNQARQASRRAR